MVSVRVSYKLNKSYDIISGEELWLKVFQEETLTGSIQLLKSSQIWPDGQTGELHYIPSQGWQVGTYSFHAELFGAEGENSMQITQMEYINIRSEAYIQAVSWKILGILISVTFTAILVIVGLIIYRKRDMLRGY